MHFQTLKLDAIANDSKTNRCSARNNDNQAKTVIFGRDGFNCLSIV